MKYILGGAILILFVIFLAFQFIEDVDTVVVENKIIQLDNQDTKGQVKDRFIQLDDSSLALENSQLRDENHSLRAELEAMRKKLAKEERRREQASISTERFTFDRDGEAVFLFDADGNELFYLDLKNNIFSLKDGIMAGKEGKIFFNKTEIAGDNISDNSKEKSKVRFENVRDEEINVFWVDYKGNPRHYKTLQPGEQFSQNTYVSHPWVFTDSNGKPIQNYQPEASDEVIEIPIE